MDGGVGHVGGNPDVVAFDEAQFFDDALIQVVDRLAHRGIRVVVAGLDTDYLGNPFGPMPALMCRAEYVTKLQAICVRCGQPANRSYRKTAGSEQIEVGGAEEYEAVCRGCHASLRRADQRTPDTVPTSTPST
jgi:thymidine kinase